MIDDLGTAQEMLPALVGLAEFELHPAPPRMIDRAGRASGCCGNGVPFAPAGRGPAPVS